MKPLKLGELESSKKTRPNSLVGVDLLRHLFVLAVIFQHMSSQSRYSDAVNGQLAHWSPLVDGAVAGFFLLSGYFFRPGMTRQSFAARAKRLLIPYVAFSLVYTAVLGSMGKMRFQHGIVNILDGAGVGPQLYFLPYLLLIWTCWGLIIDRVPEQRRKLATATTLLVVFLVYLVLPTRGSTGPDPHLLPLYALAFVWGFYRRAYAGELISNVAIGIAIVSLFAIPWQARVWDLPLVLLLTEVSIRGSALLNHGGRLPGSGGIYLLHTPVLNYALSTFVLMAGIGGFENAMITLVLTYVVALLMTLTAIRVAPYIRPFLLE